MRLGYHSLRIKKEDISKISYAPDMIIVSFLFMFFGLTIPSYFYGITNKVFIAYFQMFIIIFIDDILVYSQIELEHDQFLRIVSQKLREWKFYAKFSMCKLSCHYVIFGSCGDYRIWVDPKKDEVVQNWLGLLLYWDSWFLSLGRLLHVMIQFS